jgi:hypothetical protein
MVLAAFSLGQVAVQDGQAGSPSSQGQVAVQDGQVNGAI